MGQIIDHHSHICLSDICAVLWTALKLGERRLYDDHVTESTLNERHRVWAMPFGATQQTQQRQKCNAIVIAGEIGRRGRNSICALM
jgi:hypothetical protein